MLYVSVELRPDRIARSACPAHPAIVRSELR